MDFEQERANVRKEFLKKLHYLMLEYKAEFEASVDNEYNIECVFTVPSTYDENDNLITPITEIKVRNWFDYDSLMVE